MKLLELKIVILLLILFNACQAPVQDDNPDDASDYHKSFIDANRYIRERSRQHIMAFLERTGWKMKESSTGLWYKIEEEGKGSVIEQNMRVTYAFKTRLITGQICYVSDTLNPKTIVAGKGNIESGLQEGILLLQEKSKARFIIPPHLAHGNFGDGNKIPGASVIIVDVHILEVN